MRQRWWRRSRKREEKAEQKSIAHTHIALASSVLWRTLTRDRPALIFFFILFKCKYKCDREWQGCVSEERQPVTYIESLSKLVSRKRKRNSSTKERMRNTANDKNEQNIFFTVDCGHGRWRWCDPKTARTKEKKLVSPLSGFLFLPVNFDSLTYLLLFSG